MVVSHANFLHSTMSDLGGAWKATETLPVSDLSLPGAPAESQLLLKKESRVRILLSPADSADQRICIKLYRVPNRLRWRTAYSVARARRELDNLQAAYDAKVPVIRALDWAEERHLGLMQFNAIATEYVAGKNMADMLREPDTDATQRIELIKNSGKLLAKLHQVGMVWMTALPRNIIVDEAKKSELLALDMPYGSQFGDSIKEKAPAIYDLHMMLKYGLSQERFDTPDATAFLEAYCNSDVTKMRLLTERLKNRSKTGDFINRIALRSLAIAKSSLQKR